MKNLNEHEPMPVRTSKINIWKLVIKDMRQRDAIGFVRYNGHLTPHDGRDTLVDAYQEALDLAVYLRKAIYERGS